MIGPRPIDTVGNSQKSGISHGCGYDDRPPPGAQLAAEVLELLVRQAPFEERARVDAGRGVALEVDDVAVAVVVLAAEEVVEPDFVQRRRRGVGRDVAADAVRRRGWPRTTIAIAFQRTRLLMRRSISWLPGSGVCSSARIVLTYGVSARERQADAGRRARDAAATTSRRCTRSRSPCWMT